MRALLQKTKNEKLCMCTRGVQFGGIIVFVFLEFCFWFLETVASGLNYHLTMELQPGIYSSCTGFEYKTEFQRFFEILRGRLGRVKSRKIEGTQVELSFVRESEYKQLLFSDFGLFLIPDWYRVFPYCMTRHHHSGQKKF